MFTGIIQEIGTLSRLRQRGSGLELAIDCPGLRPRIGTGDSVCCNGVCLTAEGLTPAGFSVFAVAETLNKTNLGSWRLGERVNLELSLTPSTPMGGHFVMGHVDAAVRVLRHNRLGDDGSLLTAEIPEELTRYCVAKGSVGLNGVSLTVAEIKGAEMTVALVPHTLAHTNLAGAALGLQVNLEVDVLGKYVEKLLGPHTGESESLTERAMKAWGYHA